MPASLGSDDAKQMEAVEMAGIEREHLPIELFGLAQTAGLVMAKRCAEYGREMRRSPDIGALAPGRRGASLPSAHGGAVARSGFPIITRRRAARPRRTRPSTSCATRPRDRA